MIDYSLHKIICTAAEADDIYEDDEDDGNGEDVDVNDENCGQGGGEEEKAKASLNRRSSAYRRFMENPEAHIISGHDANDHAWPWQVLLRLSGARCGGSIISKKHILTAAHCVDGKKGTVKVYVGIHDTKKLGTPIIGTFVKDPEYQTRIKKKKKKGKSYRILFGRKANSMRRMSKKGTKRLLN